MRKSDMDVARRLERLQRVLAGRQARLASTIARQDRPVATGPLGNLQRYGYPVALALAATAVFPTIAGFTWRRRKLLTKVALNGIGVWQLRRRFDAARRTGSGR